MINGYAIAASDGKLGTVSDFLFDDASWLVRWVVVDTGTWLSGRKVLLPPSVLGHIDESRQEFAVRLTKQQIKESPEIDTDRPVSRQMETGVYDYYGWSPYWGGGFYVSGLGDENGVMSGSPYQGSTQRGQDITVMENGDGDPHLRSIEAVTGFHINATDGEIGHVEDFLIEDADWSIHFLVVDTNNWWPAKRALISPRSVRKIDWPGKLVHVNVDRQQVKNSPGYDAAVTVDRAYERKFHIYYGEVTPNDRL